MLQVDYNLSFRCYKLLSVLLTRTDTDRCHVVTACCACAYVRRNTNAAGYKIVIDRFLGLYGVYKHLVPRALRALGTRAYKRHTNRGNGL